MSSSNKIDKVFLAIVVALVLCGFFIFTSAFLGLLARTGAKFSSVAFSQIFLGIFLGGLAAYFTSKIPYKLWRRSSFFLLSGRSF